MMHLMRYANVFEHDFGTNRFQFVGHHHLDREAADGAARIEVAREPHTRRVGLLRIKPKA